MPPTTRSRGATVLPPESAKEAGESSETPTGPVLLPLRDELPDAPKRRKRKVPVPGVSDVRIIMSEAVTAEPSLDVPPIPINSAVHVFELSNMPLSPEQPSRLRESRVDSTISLLISLVPVPPVPPKPRYRVIRQKPAPGLTSSAVPRPLVISSPKQSLRLVRGATSCSWTVVSTTSDDPPPSLPRVDPAIGSLPKRVSPVSSVKVGSPLKPKRRLRTIGKKTGFTKRVGKSPPKRSKWRSSRATDVFLGGSSTTSTDAESFRSDGDTGEGEATSSSSRSDSQLLESVLPRSAVEEEPAGLGPVYTAAQNEAMADVFKGDMLAASRYSAVKEWAIAEGSKVLHSGSTKQKLRAIFTEAIDKMAGGGLTIDNVESVKDEVKKRMSELDLNELKRRICVEIIKSRDADYTVYKKEPTTTSSVRE